MEPINLISYFFNNIEKDQRITLKHIGLYVSLLYVRMSKGFINPIRVYSHEVMDVAKLYAPSTYHRYLKQLHEYGYIRYEPSFKKNQASKVYFLD